MKIQYCSDLHLEFYGNKRFLKKTPLNPNADILILAGDILLFSLLKEKEYEDFFNYISDNFKTTYWIPGNHEYYHSDISERSGVLNETIKSNVFLVNNISVIHENVKLIFSTLWSKISPINTWKIELDMSDFYVIKNNKNKFTSSKFNQLHEESLNFIKQELKVKNTEKSIVVTHHVPTFMNYPEKYKDSNLNDAFTVELYDLIEKEKPDCWIYGHSHNNTPDFNIGNTKMLTNQLGYVKYNEHEFFDCNKIINI